MVTLVFAVLTQILTFLPLAFGISISYTLLRATDMTLDGSFVLGAAVFARLITLGFSPYFAATISLLAGSLAGIMVALIQRGGKVDPLLAGILALFILSSLNLLLMGRPNINLLSEPTLFSRVFLESDWKGWAMVAAYSALFCFPAYYLMRGRLGLILRALGDNPHLLERLGGSLEFYRLSGFALTNTLSAASGLLTAQTVGYADINMGFGMTLTGIGALILGQHVFKLFVRTSYMRALSEFSACFLGVGIYYFILNGLLRMGVDSIYLKMILGCVLILFLRAALKPHRLGEKT